MKKLFLSISLIFISYSLIAQDPNPNYFHDLRGFEDSTGATQLFYRLYEPKLKTCGYPDGNGGYVSSQEETYNNHLYHYNSLAISDSLLVQSYYSVDGFCELRLSLLKDVDFVNNDPSKYYQFKVENFGSVEATKFLMNPRNQKLVINSFLDVPTRLDYDEHSDALYFSFLDWNNGNEVTQKLFAQDSMWANEQYYEAEFDSAFIPYRFIGFNSLKQSFILTHQDSLFYYSERDKELIYKSSNGYINEFGKILVDADSISVYLITKFKLDAFVARKNDNEWTFKELLHKSNTKRIAINASNSGHLYLSDSTKVFFSEDYGDSMQEILEFDEEVTGLYKKPNSEILYVLTRTDLYRVENGQSTSIKQVPVSNEENPEIPTSISLKQNYPNPFNPTTTIQFELDKATFTKLTVYDVLGRKVQELVNEVRPAGTNTIQFDATNLASGVYLYRLEANGIVQTKRLTLIK